MTDNDPNIRRHGMIKDVANTIKRQLDRHDDLEIGYTIQRLSRMNQEGIQEVFRPLDKDFADWFRRLSDKGSHMFALKDMDRVTSYLGTIWPEMSKAVDEYKDQILISILTAIADGHIDYAKREIKSLGYLEVKWPEIASINKSLSQALLPESKSSDREEGRRMLIDIMQRHLDKGKRGIYYVMYHMDEWGFNIKDWPEIADMIETRRDEIIREMLVSLVDHAHHKDAASSAMFNINRLKKIGVEWPELKSIEKSLSPAKISEDRYDDDNDDDEDEETKAYDNKWRRDLEYKEYLRALRHDMQTGYWDMVPLSLVDIDITDDSCVLPSDVVETIRSNKDELIKAMLNDMVESKYPQQFLHSIDVLNRSGIDWIELNSIRKSLSSGNQGL